MMTRSTATPNRPASELRILFADDDTVDLKLTVKLIERAGHVISFDVAKSLSNFQKLLQQNDYELIITDYKLREGTALDALELSRKSNKDIPFIVVSGGLGDEAAVSLLKNGATDYVLKNRRARLASAIQRALEDKRARDERHRASNALRESEMRYRNLFKYATCGICLIDADGNFMEANQAMIEMLGCQSEVEVLGLNVASAVYRHREERESLLMEASQHDRFRGIRVEMNRRDGRSVSVRLSGRTVRDDHGQVNTIEMIAEDTTEHEHLEKQIHQLQKFEAIGRLAGGMAHDFNNQLSVILGYSERILGSLAPADPLHKAASRIREAALRAAGLTNQLLAFGRGQVLKPRILDLNRFVRQYTNMLRKLLGKEIEVIARLEPGLGLVSADPSQLDQVMMNLAVNARDAMPQGGRLIIGTSNAELDESHVRLHSFVKPGRYVMLQVSDSGVGMTEEIQRHLFEPFFTTKEGSKGTGLGLATVYGIVSQSGGFIGVDSELGRGTTFKIYFPRVERAAQPIVEIKPAVSKLKGMETVLAVEDKTVLRKLVCDFLQEDGYTVLDAGTGREAIELSERYAGPIQLLITDVMMPGMGGRELRERLQISRPEMKVLYVSGYTDDAILRRCGLLDSGTAFLQKPFTRNALERKIRELLESGAPPEQSGGCTQGDAANI